MQRGREIQSFCLEEKKVITELRLLYMSSPGIKNLSKD